MEKFEGAVGSGLAYLREQSSSLFLAKELEGKLIYLALVLLDWSMAPAIMGAVDPGALAAGEERAIALHPAGVDFPIVIDHAPEQQKQDCD